MEKHIHEIKKSGFEPDWVGIAPWSLYLFCREYFSNLSHLLVLYSGERESVLLAILEGRLITSIFIPYGKDSEEIKESYFQRALQFCLEKDKEKKMTRYLFLGEQMDREFFVRTLPTRFQEEFLKSSFDPKTLEQFALEIGTALNVLSAKTMQFRRGRNSSEKHLKAIRKKIYYALFSAILIPGCLFAFCEKILFDQEKQIASLLQEMVTTTQSPQILPSLHFLQSRQNLEIEQEVLQHLRVYVEKKNPFSYLHKLPLSVAEILHAISTHPLLQECTQLETFHYEIVQYPNFDKPYQDYKIKVDFTLSGEDPAVFKEFFQQIKEKGDPFVHAKKDSTYTREGDKHTFSFILKDKI